MEEEAVIENNIITQRLTDEGFLLFKDFRCYLSMFSDEFGAACGVGNTVTRLVSSDGKYVATAT